jgi:glycosyltransferase involved in cell wall biosynthesis
MSSYETIGIDARFYGEAGPGRYAKAVVEHLEQIDTVNHYKVFLRDKGYSLYEPKNPNFEKIKAHYKWYTWEEQLFFLRALLRARLDLFYAPHFNIPILFPGKIVTAIPDIIMHSFSTEKGTTLPKFYFRFKKLVYKFVVFWAVFRSKKVIVPSKAVIEEFKEAFPRISANKYVLAYEGVDPVLLDSSRKGAKIADVTLGVIRKDTSVLRKYNVTKPFLLYVSSMYEHKNVPFLIDGFERLLQEGSFSGQLVLVGKKDKFSEEIQALIKEKGLEDKVLMPGMQGYVSDTELVTLRSYALGYVFPSLKEGFSLTPLEAQAVGLPCIISGIDVHREIYKDAVAYFDPYDLDDFVTQLKDFVTSEGLRKSLIEKGHSLVKEYDWGNTAKITLDVFRTALES